MEFFLGIFFPYMAVIVFLTGTLLRLKNWLRTPVPFHLTLFPAPCGSGARVWSIVAEFLLCRSLFRENRFLWLPVWLFHLSLVLILVGHAFGIFFLRAQFTLIGLGIDAAVRLSLILGGAMGVIISLSIAALACRRLVSGEVRRLSAPVDYFQLFLLLAVALSGMAMYFPGFQADLREVRNYMGGLLWMQPVPLPRNSTFLLHFSLVNFLMIYFPFSTLLHSAGFFVIKTMLSEAPPLYPTPSGARPRTSYATMIASNLPVPRQTPPAGEGEER